MTIAIIAIVILFIGLALVLLDINGKISEIGTGLFIAGFCVFLISYIGVKIASIPIPLTEEFYAYQYENIEFIGVKQSEEDVCDLYQAQIIKNYFNKLNSKILKVKLVHANYTLQRGMLVEVIINEYNAINKQAIINNGNNATTIDKDTPTEAPGQTFEQRAMVADENNGITNPSLSGLYYINGMELIYNAGYQKFEQVLYLIKKGISNNILNKYTSVNLPPEV